ncbi:MAG: ABC-2 type transport system permease protein [Psychromonas sp.]|jgi:ABC-2 type transport system permease protein|uniref:ABC transporter permease n=1 Tax=Psychromonas sp. TaxID=1884585 RepID=UPI0039E614A9
MRLFELIKAELKAVLSNPVIALTVFGGVIFYSFLYPLPYAQQTPREQEISVVNLDNSQTSRQLERMVDATPQVKIVKRAHSINEAKAQLLQGDVSGILLIPEHFYRDLLLGKSPTLSYAGDASYFLVYGTIVEGLANAGGTLAAKAKVTRLIMDGVPLDTAKEQYAQVKLNMKPTFNPTLGYLSYVVPAVFVLILQQTLIMGVGILGCMEKFIAGYWNKHTALTIITIRSLIFVAIYYLMAIYYFGFCFDFYGINKLASPLIILALLAPFLLCSTFIGIFLGALLPRRELVTFVVLISSMPLIFSAGFIWPLESVPLPMIWLSNLFPCTPAIQSFLAVNQMGAEFSQILPQWQLLWLQVFIWGALAYVAYRRAQRIPVRFQAALKGRIKPLEKRNNS